MADLDKYLEDLGISVDETEISPADPNLENPLDNELIAQHNTIETIVSPVSSQIVSSVVTSTPRERCEDFLSNLLLIIDPNYRVEIRQSASGDLKVGIRGGDPARLIGKNGYTLSALEYLTNVIINRELQKRVRITLDVNSYKQRREERLRGAIRELVVQVKKTGKVLELEPMPANDRRIIHLEISKQQGVISESVGEARDRRVILKPAAKPEDIVNNTQTDSTLG